MAKRKYSASERKAFHMGRAWAAGKDGKRVKCTDEKTKNSFRNGVKAATAVTSPRKQVAVLPFTLWTATALSLKFLIRGEIMKKILISVISFILCAVIAFVSCYFAIPDFNAWVKGAINSGVNTPDDDKNNGGDNGGNENDGSNVGEIENNGISLLCAELPVEAYAANGVAENALEAYKLTVTRSPAVSLVDDLQWTLNFINSLSSWADGKALTDYVNIKVADDNLSAVVECLQPFGERVVATVSYLKDETINATCNFDYQKQITGVRLAPDLDEFRFNTPYWVELSVYPQYSDGTINCPYMPTECSEVYYELSDEAYAAITNSKYFRSWHLTERLDPVLFTKTTVNYIKPYEGGYSPDTVVYDCRIDSFLDSEVTGTAPTTPVYFDRSGCLAAAFLEAAETVKNFYRFVATAVQCNDNTGEVVYTYGTAYSDWFELDTSHISSDALMLNGLSFPEDSYTFGQ